jgi:hypothetical protein
MIWQYLIVGAIILWALVMTSIRLFHFFKSPVSKCEGCSGCKLAELKSVKGIEM